MEITHINGKKIDTNALPDVDAILIEENKKLHELYAKYNRQLILLGDVKGSLEQVTTRGCAFFHIGDPSIINDTTKYGEAYSSIISKIDWFLRSISRDNLFVAKRISSEFPPTSSL